MWGATPKRTVRPVRCIPELRRTWLLALIFKRFHLMWMVTLLPCSTSLAPKIVSKTKDQKYRISGRYSQMLEIPPKKSSTLLYLNEDQSLQSIEHAFEDSSTKHRTKPIESTMMDSEANRVNDPVISDPTQAGASPMQKEAIDDGFTSTQNFSSFASTETPLLARLLATSEEAAFSTDEKLPSATSPTTSRGTLEQLADQSSDIAVALLAVVALSSILGDLLSQYEWVQTLRYLWPVSIGVYYGMLWNHYNETDAEKAKSFYGKFGNSAARTPSQNDVKSPLLQIGYIFGGFGLLVGGLADAFLPVWMTGPNLLTHAGLAPDCAVLLLCLSISESYGWIDRPLIGQDGSDDDGNCQKSEILASEPNNTLESQMPLLLKITLWAELYKLGEGSIDEVLSMIQSAIP